MRWCLPIAGANMQMWRVICIWTLVMATGLLPLGLSNMLGEDHSDSAQLVAGPRRLVSHSARQPLDMVERESWQDHLNKQILRDSKKSAIATLTQHKGLLGAKAQVTKGRRAQAKRLREAMSLTGKQKKLMTEKEKKKARLMEKHADERREQYKALVEMYANAEVPQTVKPCTPGFKCFQSGRLRELTFVQGQLDLDNLYPEIVKFRTVRRLFILGTSGTFSKKLSNAFPNLRSLTLHGGDAIEEGVVFPNLRVLVVHDSKVQVMPDSLFTRKLREVRLRYNFEMTSLPDSFMRESRVSILQMRNIPQLAVLPDTLGPRQRKALMKMTINDVGITSFPESYRTLPRLKRLQISATSLETLPSLNFTTARIIEVVNNVKLKEMDPDFLKHSRRVKRVMLNGNDLRDIPHYLGQNVRTVSLDSNPQIRSMPPEIFTNSPWLQELYLDGCGLISLPKEIQNAKKLTVLHLGNNRISELPSEFGNVSSLKDLNLRANRLPYLPDSIGKLNDLRRFDAGSNLLKALPESMGNWTMLGIFKIPHNNIMHLPKGFSDLNTLLDFDVMHNKIEELPRWTRRLRDFTQLRAGDNQLKRIDESLCNAHNLEFIDLGSNAIRTVPGCMFRSKKLKHIKLGSNRLEQLDTETFSQSIVGLELQLNRLKSVPAGLFTMRLMRMLDLSNNMLEHLPKVSNSTISQIIASSNRLKEIPKELFSGSLLNLNVEKNLLETLPSIEKEQITRLMVLSAGHNRISSLPSEFSCHQLKRLYLDFNMITRIPEGFVTSLGHLEELHMASNAIYAIPDNVNELKSLTSLNLSRNNIKKIPGDSLHFSRMHDVDLSENEISVINLYGRRWKYASLRKNRFTSLPYVELESLVQLDLSENQISTMDTVWRYRMKGDTKLNLSKNKIVTFPGSPFSVDLQENPIRNCVGAGCKPAQDTHSVSIFDTETLTNLAEYLQDIVPSYDSKNLQPTPIAQEGSDDRRSIHSLSVSFLDMEFDGKPGRHREIAAKKDAALFDWTSLMNSEAAAMAKYYLGGEASFFSDFFDIPDSIRETNRVLSYDSLRRSMDFPTTLDDSNKKCVLLYGVNQERRIMRIRACVCDDNFYDVNGKCVACPLFGNCKYNRVVCERGTFIEKDNDEVTCSHCPAGAVCYGDERLIPQKGYWVNNQTVYTCTTPSACEGGTNNTCAEGHSGTLCSICEPGYFKESSGKCTVCPDFVYSFLYLGAMTLGLMIGFTFLLGMGDIRNISKTDQGSGNQSTSVQGDGMEDIGGGMKILINFVQVLAALASFDVTWPAWMSSLMDFMGFINMDFLSASSLECLWEAKQWRDMFGLTYHDSSDSLITFSFSYFEVMSLVFLAPWVAGVLSWLVTRFVILMHWVVRPKSDWFKQKVKTYAPRLVLLIWVLMYLPIAQRSFGFLRCRSFDDRKTFWIVDDLSTQCYTRKWYTYLPVTLFTIVVYNLGLPLLILVVLRPGGRIAKNVDSPFTRLFIVYREKYRWWESCEMVRKLLMTSVAITMSRHGSFQCTVSMFVCFFALIVHMLAWPFQHKLLNYLQLVQLTLIYLMLAIGQLKRLHPPEGTASTYSITLMLLSIVAMIFSVIMFAILILYRIAIILDVGVHKKVKNFVWRKKKEQRARELSRSPKTSPVASRVNTHTMEDDDEFAEPRSFADRFRDDESVDSV